MSEVINEKINTEVILNTDVLVLGSGPAGITAAIASSRKGSGTILLERYGYFGGLTTGGLVSLLEGNTDGKGNDIKGGIYNEIINKLVEANATLKYKNSNIMVDPEILKFVYQKMLLDNRISSITSTTAVNAITEGDIIKYIIMENKAGRSAIKPKVVIDCTGDADTAKWCGVPFELPEKERLKPVTLVFRCGNVDIEQANLFKEINKVEFKKLKEIFLSDYFMNLYWLPTTHSNEVWFNVININGCNSLEVDEIRDAEFVCREKIISSIDWLRKNIPGFETAFLIDTASQMGIRESRRIRGKYILKKTDCDKGIIFDDSVVLNTSKYLSGRIFGIPYRCLQPAEGPKNLLFAGRCISVEQQVLDVVRIISSCACMGQAAGTAASMSLKENMDVGEIESSDLVDQLKKDGVILEYGN